LFLFILESIGTSELILIGIVALIFLGPRKLPEIARKIGKMTSEFRGTANEFKQTWQREVDFEEEAKAFDLNKIEAEAIAREPKPEMVADQGVTPAAPSVKEVNPADFDALRSARMEAEKPIEEKPMEPDDKRNWL